MRLQPDVDIRQPFVQLFGAAAIHRGKRTDHAVAAGGHYQFNTGYEKHRCRDQRQAEAVAKARQGIDCWQSISSRLEQPSCCASVAGTLARAKANYKTAGEKNEQSALCVSG